MSLERIARLSLDRQDNSAERYTLSEDKFAWNLLHADESQAQG